MKPTRRSADLARRLASCAVAALVAVALCPGHAQADGGLAAAPAHGLTAQSSTATVYVLTSSETKPANDGLTVKTSYAYKKGLLSKTSTKQLYRGKDVGLSSSAIRRYDKRNRLASITMGGLEGATSVTMSYDSKNRLKKSRLVNGGYDFTTTYKHGSYGVTSATRKSAKSSFYQQTTKYTLIYKNGKVAKLKEKATGSSARTSKYSYDSNGNHVEQGGSNSYNSKGLLAKRTSSTGTTTYKYKAVKVSKSLASTVKAQQWALLNDNLNLAIGPIDAH